jgi:AAA domain (dynein-related subfamily)
MFTAQQKLFIETAIKTYGQETLIGRKEILEIQKLTGVPYPVWFINEYKVARGQYKIPSLDSEIKSPIIEQPKPQEIEMIKSIEEDVTIVPPEVDPDYIPFGFFSDLDKIVKSQMFFPVMVVGHHGSGKSKMIEQVCAKLKRKFIRFNVHKETDEVSLLGGPTLINGNIVYKEGPVITAMRNGYVLLIDEVDRANAESLLCLQSIMEGSSFYNKHTGEIIKPKSGFNIIATANTKGFGATGKYLSQILDEAFLERFNITIEQEYPTLKVEKEILSKHIQDEIFVDNLCKWSQIIRESFYQNAIDSLISTRRLIQIAKTYAIFKNKKKALEFCLNRFEDEEKIAFIDLYNKIDSGEELVSTQEEIGE